MIPGLLAFQRATLKSWEWLGDEAKWSVHLGQVGFTVKANKVMITGTKPLHIYCT